MLEKLPDLVNQDRVLLRRGRHCSTVFMVEIDRDQSLLTVADGHLAPIEPGPVINRSWTFALRAATADWAKFWEPMPAPGYHDLFAMLRHDRLRIEGEIHPFMANLFYFKGVMAKPRGLGWLEGAA